MQMTPTRRGYTDWLDAWSGQGFDDTMALARTGFYGAWDGAFTAVCPHGDVVIWVSVPLKNPYPMCDCRGA